MDTTAGVTVWAISMNALPVSRRDAWVVGALAVPLCRASVAGVHSRVEAKSTPMPRQASPTISTVSRVLMGLSIRIEPPREKLANCSGGRCRSSRRARIRLYGRCGRVFPGRHRAVAQCWTRGEGAGVQPTPPMSAPLLLFADDLVVGLDDVLVLLGRRLFGRSSVGLARLRAGAGRLVRLGRDLVPELLQIVQCGLDLGVVVLLQRLARPLERGLDLDLLVARHLVLEVLEVLLRRVDQRVRPVAELDPLAALLVLGGVRLGVLDHLLDLALVQPARGLDPDLLLLAGGLVLGRHVQDPVGVDVERDF